MQPDEMECEAMTPAPDYRTVFEDAYQLALKLCDSRGMAEQIAADAASTFHLNRGLRPPKDF
jgi:hypothetical protein